MNATHTEIEEMHRGLASWIRGECPDAAEVFATLLGDRFTPSFELISPSGACLPGARVLERLRGAHASSPGFRIRISDVRVIAETPEIVVARCIEWQKGALQSKPPDNARWLTILFRKDVGRPTGLCWEHLQETQLSESAIPVGAFDF